MRVVSLNVGLPAQRRYGDEEVVTGGLKRHAFERVWRHEDLISVNDVIFDHPHDPTLVERLERGERVV